MCEDVRNCEELCMVYLTTFD